MLNARQLEIFVGVFQEGSLSKAARRLHAAQSGLSMQIQSLEVRTGLRLFDRSPRGVSPSATESACAQMAPVFAAISRKVVQAGPFGAGMKLKCVANLLVSVHNLATAEAMLLAQRAGLDLAMTFDAPSRRRRQLAGVGAERPADCDGPLRARFDEARSPLEGSRRDQVFRAIRRRADAAARRERALLSFGGRGGARPRGYVGAL